MDMWKGGRPTVIQEAKQSEGLGRVFLPSDPQHQRPLVVVHKGNE